MKRFLLLVTALTAVMAANVDSFAQSREQCGGTAAMYEFGKVEETPAPKGYKPYYISHYGRHGARWSTSSKPYEAVMDYLQMGHDSLMLTPLGEEMYSRYLAVFPLLKLTHGDLSSKGEAQHKLLADRMVETYPQVFKKSPVIDAHASIVPRAIVSMGAFCTELQKEVPSATIFQRSYVKDLFHTNPISEINPYMTVQMFEDMKASAVRAIKKIDLQYDPDVFASRLFTRTDFLKAREDYYTFEQAFYDTMVHMPCIESPDNLEDFFTDDALLRWWKVANFQNYEMMRTPQYRALSFPLVRDLADMVEADEANGIDVRLRFGHDMVLFSLLGLLEVDGWGGEYEGLEEVCSNWKNYEVPMAANFRMVLYRNRKGDTIGKILFNEKEAVLPIESESAPYYSWESLKKYLLDKADEAENLLKSELTGKLP